VSPRAYELARQRNALIARCEAQRRRTADLVQRLKSVSRVVDRTLGIARYLRAHPLLVAAAVAALTIASRAGWLRRLGSILPLLSPVLRAWPSRRRLGFHAAGR